MTTRPRSILYTLFRSLILPSIIAMMLGVLLVFDLMKEEYDELQDSEITTTAHLLLSVFDAATQSADPFQQTDLSTLLVANNAAVRPEERMIYWFFDTRNQILAQSPEAATDLLPPDFQSGLQTVHNHRFVTLNRQSADAVSVIVGLPLIERSEALRDLILGVSLGLLLLLILFATAAFWAARRSVRMIAALSQNIAQKGEHDLSPIDRQNAFAEIEPAIDTLDTLMARLDVALSAERAFATNAAHELRTPVAISLAHVQRLKAKLDTPTLTQSASEIERGLKRLVQLIERLLQMSRAQSGLGVNAVEADINPVVSLLLKELRDRAPDPDQLVIKPPTGVWRSYLDPDALGIMLNNLFENALKYASGPTPTVVDASTAGRIVVSNDCAPLPSADLDLIKERFIRKAPAIDGFGLGLSIVQALCQQSGCTFETNSPQPGKDRGFVAVLTFPAAP